MSERTVHLIRFDVARSSSGGRDGLEARTARRCASLATRAELLLRNSSVPAPRSSGLQSVIPSPPPQPSGLSAGQKPSSAVLGKNTKLLGEVAMELLARMPRGPPRSP